MSESDPLGDQWPLQPSRAARQVHAVLAWLVVDADVPNDVHLHLVDALLAWAPLMGEHLFPDRAGSRRRRRPPPSAGRHAVAA